jgi:hypothetical protein
LKKAVAASISRLAQLVRAVIALHANAVNSKRLGIAHLNQQIA